MPECPKGDERAMEQQKPTEAERSPSPLRLVHEVRADLQKLRIAVGNREGALGRLGVDADLVQRSFGVSSRRLNNLLAQTDGNPVPIGDLLIMCEKAVEATMEAHLIGNKVWERWLKQVKGVGPVTGAALLSQIDFRIAKTPSGLWRYCGMDVREGRAPRRRRGEKGGYNSFMKMLCWRIAGQMLKSASPYRRLYDEAREYYNRRAADQPRGCAFPDQEADCHANMKADHATACDWDGCPREKHNSVACDLHMHMASLRRMVKVFLAHLWQIGREVEGLPTRTPYAIEKLGHETVLSPWEFCE